MNLEQLIEDGKLEYDLAHLNNQVMHIQNSEQHDGANDDE